MQIWMVLGAANEQSGHNARARTASAQALKGIIKIELGWFQVGTENISMQGRAKK
jgi:hypothetical protein